MVILRISSPLGTAFLIAFVDLLPVLGCGTVLVPWAILSFFIGRSGLGIGLLVVYLITLFAHQMAEPKIVGSSIGLHPVLSLALVILGLRLYGLFGMLLLPLGFTSYLKARDELNEESKKSTE